MADPGSARAALDRGRFLSGVTVGLGGLMSAVIAAPALGFVLAPAFETDRTRRRPRADEPVPGGQVEPFHVVTFTRSPSEIGDLERRVAFIRNDGGDKFTAISNTCMHLGCPVRAFGSAGFGCPCHGGQYDAEGRRTAGPPVRPLNRYDTRSRGPPVPRRSLRDGRLATSHLLKAPGQPVTGCSRSSIRRPRGGASRDATHPSDCPRTGRRRPPRMGRGALRLRRPVEKFLFRNVPGDTSWLQTLGSSLLIVFVLQAVTGVMLAMYYHPTSENAFDSIRYITDEATLGWLVRGMHKWGSSVMVILLFLHMGRVFLFGAYKYPREMTWITGAILFILVMAMSFTGYLLVFDQRAYWATVVGVNINGTAPIVGPYLADFLKAGPEFNGHTLSRFYSLHMLVIPGGIMPSSSCTCGSS